MNATTKQPSKSTALYLRHQADAKALLETLHASLATHSRIAGEVPTYAECGDLEHVVNLLKETNAFLLGSSR